MIYVSNPFFISVALCYEPRTFTALVEANFWRHSAQKTAAGVNISRSNSHTETHAHAYRTQCESGVN